MAEIRINSKPCPNCGYRNVTGEARVCERCGTSIIKGKLLIWGGVGVLALVLLLAAGIFISQGNKGSLQPILPKEPAITQTTPKVTPQAPTPTPERIKEVAPVNQAIEDQKEEIATPVAATPVAETPSEEAPSFSTPVGSRENLPAKYLEDIEGAEQLIDDLPVRVQSGPVGQFRSKAFEKLAENLRSPKYAGKKVYVIAFAESVGSAFIAENRAKFVAKVLRENYHVSQVLYTSGFGPAKVNSDAIRRIEVWVK